MDKTYITKPLLPSLDALNVQLREIWNTKIVTNSGPKHNLLEQELKFHLGVDNVSLFNNGTLALLTALKAVDLPIGSEVITTPFTFAATPHCISWNGLKPIFCDIDYDTMCIDANKIEQLITPNTSAILGVHVYGFPCDVEKIQHIADKYNLKVIYDAAHAFSTKIDGVDIGNFGDITMFSFHATKLFTTLEGGCLTYSDDNLAHKIYNLRNFGICSEELVEEVGINGKMNEIQAAIGLLNLKQYKEEQERRRKIKQFYDESFRNLPGIRLPLMPLNTTNSYQYYPIIVEDKYSLSRDELYDKLMSNGIDARKYFYPLCSDYECYKDLSSSSEANLAVANYYKTKVLCLPYYGSLDSYILESIVETIRN